MFDAYVQANRDRFLDELMTFCRIPSVTSEGDDGREAAQWVQRRLEAIGAEVELIALDGAPPVVYAEVGPPGAERTLLIYNHYDVQPPDPLELWETPPFEPQVRAGHLYARGVADNKANVVSRIQAVEAWQATRGELPVRIKWIVEGEEEMGSPHLALLAERHGHRFADAHGCLWESGYKDADGRYLLYCGLKGIAYFELRARGAQSDLHSSMGTLVPNPAWRLVWALNTLKAPDETILVEGLMDHVRPPDPDELEYVRRLPFDAAALRERYGIAAFVGNVEDAEALVRHLYAPTCTICGIHSGYGGQGSKTVLPSEAVAKVDFRLVPDLTPELVHEVLRAHLDKHGFEDIEVIPMDGVRPARSPITSPVAQAAAAAARQVSGLEPVVYPNMAASGPMYTLCDAFGIPAVGFGVGWTGSNVHAPNENVRLKDYFDGIRLMAAFIEHFGRTAAAA